MTVAGFDFIYVVSLGGKVNPGNLMSEDDQLGVRPTGFMSVHEAASNCDSGRQFPRQRRQSLSLPLRWWEARAGDDKA